MIKVITYQPYEQTNEDVFFFFFTFVLCCIAVVATSDDAVAVVIIIVRIGLINITLFAYGAYIRIVLVYLWRRAWQQY